MTPAEWKRLASPALGPEWNFSKLLAYCAPVGWVLHGVLAERSRAGGFYLWSVRMPLYVRSTVLDLSWSERVGGGACVWEDGAAATQAVVDTGASIIDEVKAADCILIPPPGGADNVRMQEARAYGLVLEDAVTSAIEVLGRVCRYEASYPWEHDIVARASEVRAMLAGNKVQDVLALLAEWRSSTAAVLGVRLS